METVWKMIFNALQEAGIETYPPATKVGECLSEYVVVKKAGSSPVYRKSTEYVFYMFLLYVPRVKYSELDAFEKRVKHVLHEKLYPTLMPLGTEENDYYDDNYNAHMRSFTYRSNVRNKFI